MNNLVDLEQMQLKQVVNLVTVSPFSLFFFLTLTQLSSDTSFAQDK